MWYRDTKRAEMNFAFTPEQEMFCDTVRDFFDERIALTVVRELMETEIGFGLIGFTWGHDAHLYFKRAKTSQLMFGDSNYWRLLLADRLDL